MDKFKIIKQLGDGTFGCVYMASNLGNGEIVCAVLLRDRLTGSDQVAVKKMKQKFSTWDQCTQLRELKSLAKLNNHANIVKLKEVIRDQATEELNFVFEYMETNMHERVKEREGRAFSEEELMSGNTVKIADFGLARETRSLPPYTEYVSTRWYRAPEVLLKTHNYSSPIDIWAVGTILAELFLLYPLFPGTSEVDQLHKICSVLGNPAMGIESNLSSGANAGGMVGSNMRVSTPLMGRESYTFPDASSMRPQTSHSPLLSKNTILPQASSAGGVTRDRIVGGGPWIEGLKLAAAMGFKFPNMTPIPLSEVICASGTVGVSTEALTMIAEMLVFDPNRRFTANEALQQNWFKSLPMVNSTGGGGSQSLPRSSSFQKQPEVAASPAANVNTRSMVADVSKGLGFPNQYPTRVTHSEFSRGSQVAKPSSDLFDFLSEDDEDHDTHHNPTPSLLNRHSSTKASPRLSTNRVSAAAPPTAKTLPFELKDAILQKRKPDSETNLFGSVLNNGLAVSGVKTATATPDHTDSSTTHLSSTSSNMMKYDYSSPGMQFTSPKASNRVCPAPIAPIMRPQTNHCNASTANRYAHIESEVIQRDSVLERRSGLESRTSGVVSRLKGSLSSSDLALGMIPSLTPASLESTATTPSPNTPSGLGKQYRPLPEIGKSNLNLSNFSVGSSCLGLQPCIGTSEDALEKNRNTRLNVLPSVLRK
ncbi:hypothetical protein HDU98_011039 [Podochytrium sp. JEL0797]|nr:hypothetical protein HDU98_011039 [Podochytrium sp. JEL0797]